MKRLASFAVGALALLGAATASHARVQVVTRHNGNAEATSAFRFDGIPSPSSSDAAAKATFTVVYGRRDPNGGDLDKLHDGYVPGDEDEPAESFFFRAGTAGGRLVIDLGTAVDVRQVNTYSWHPGTRGPQVYTLYAGDGKADGFSAEPKEGTDPATCGWRRLAAVDTRAEAGKGGGQYGVSVCDSGGLLGRFRYLLFDIARTEADDSFGNTFYSEIDVVDATTPPVAATTVPRPGALTVEADSGAYQIVIDTSETPDLTEWATKELAPVLQEWYPKIVRLLPSDGYQAPRRFSVLFSKDMQGVAATGGTRVQCAGRWFRQNLTGEAKGAVVHELVHVVQRYGGSRRGNRNATPTPGWLVEGIADYIRWFLYEPQSHGAEISRQGLARARYDASYRTSANFLNWVIGQHGDRVLRELNAAARLGAYDEGLWKKLTGHTVQELGDQWKAALEKQLAPTPA